MPAVSWPSEASFSVCTRRSCAVRRSSSDFVRSSVRSRSSLSSRVFSIAITAWLAKLLNKRNLLFVERQNFQTVNSNSADEFVVLDHRNDDNRASARHVCELQRGGIAQKIGRTGTEVVDVSKLFCLNHLCKRSDRMRPKALRSGCSKLRRHVVEAHGMKTPVFIKIHEAELRAANARGIFEHALEYRLQVAGRPADDAQHFRRCRLLFQ